MRTIKFRAKEPKSGMWLYGSLIQYESGEMAIAKFSQYGHECTNMRRTIVDPGTVGQFTGLLDSDGKEIYEGDLLLSHEDGNVLEVIYDAPRFCLNDNDLGYRFLNHPENFVVVDNIHKGG